MKNQMPIALLLAIGAMISTSVVQAAIRVDANPPFYAIINNTADFGQEIYHDDEWAAIPFFRDPACVPEDFNLLDFFDFRLLPGEVVCPLTVDGFEIWENGPGLDPAPIQVQLEGTRRGAGVVCLLARPANTHCGQLINHRRTRVHALPEDWFGHVFHV